MVRRVLFALLVSAVVTQTASAQTGRGSFVGWLKGKVTGSQTQRSGYTQQQQAYAQRAYSQQQGYQQAAYSQYQQMVAQQRASQPTSDNDVLRAVAAATQTQQRQQQQQQQAAQLAAQQRAYQQAQQQRAAYAAAQQRAAQQRQLQAQQVAQRTAAKQTPAQATQSRPQMTPQQYQAYMARMQQARQYQARQFQFASQSRQLQARTTPMTRQLTPTPASRSAVPARSVSMASMQHAVEGGGDVYSGGTYPVTSAGLYSSPSPNVPYQVGMTAITNQALYPHEFLYPHSYRAIYPPYYYKVKGGWVVTPFGVWSHEKWKPMGTEVNVNYRSRISPFSGFIPPFIK